MNSTPKSASQCTLRGTCSGCAWLDVPYDIQLVRKRDELAALLAAEGVPFPEIRMIEIDARGGLRDRVDLTWQRGADGKLALGLYDVTRSRLVDVAECPQLSTELDAWLAEFRAAPPPYVQRGSVRLRVSPDGTRGVWLDLANADVKSLLEEKSWLNSLARLAHVEIGQRFKTLNGDTLKLGATPVPKPWFQTYIGENLEPLPLFSVVGSFTQPGFRANRKLVESLLELARPLAGARTLELFSGLGNFTLPLASLGNAVSAFEVDAVALECLGATLDLAPGLARKLSYARENLYGGTALPGLGEFDLLVVDPPRSGLKEVRDLIENTARARRPAALLYVSCYAESMAQDLAGLTRCGYAINQLRGIDQFPHSTHCEWMALLTMGTGT